jgi:hypothetical protein
MTNTINCREQGSVQQRINPWLVLLLCLIGTVSGCASGGKHMTESESACRVVQETEPPQGVLNNVDDILTVDCLLPGQLIQIGMNQTWMTPNRPAIISARLCKMQGGQYAIGYTSDARKSALNVWQQCADQGDKVAQNYLGEIYARSWDNIKPDFTQAAEWFRKAADQGWSRAQNNLGFLYENGKGVPKNLDTALNLYRQATGLVGSIKLDRTINQTTRGEIKPDATDQKSHTLQQQLLATERLLRIKQEELDKFRESHASDGNQTEVKALQQALKEARLDEQKLRGQLLESQQKLEGTLKQPDKTEAEVALGAMPNMGRYFALIIGIDDYQTPIPRLKTPVNDAKRIEAMLRQKYGFKTTLLTGDTSIKPTRDGILTSLVNLSRELKDDDNLLIYYAGHGSIYSDRGHWLPEDANSNIYDAHWISSDDIRKQIETTTMKAKRVLIVADSCYSAAIITAAIISTPVTTAAITQSLIRTRSTTSMTGSISALSSNLNLADNSPESQGSFIKAEAERPSRIALTSGGYEPVLDKDSGNGLSIFANAFLEALEKNDRVIDTEHLFLHIKPEVVAKAEKNGGNQIPVYAHIQQTGDNWGEFYFVPRTKQADFHDSKHQIAAAAKE